METCSLPSTGSPHHLAFEYFKKIAGVDVQHVVYRGAGPAAQDTVAGQVPVTVYGLPPVMELIKSGNLRAVALTSAERSVALPDARSHRQCCPRSGGQGPAPATGSSASRQLT